MDHDTSNLSSTRVFICSSIFWLKCRIMPQKLNTARHHCPFFKFYSHVVIITYYFYNNYSYSIINYYGIAFNFTLLWLKFIYIKYYYRHNWLLTQFNTFRIYIIHLDTLTSLDTFIFCFTYSLVILRFTPCSGDHRERGAKRSRVSMN